MGICILKKNEEPKVICTNPLCNTWAVVGVKNFCPRYHFFGTKKEAENYLKKMTAEKKQ